MQLDNNMRMRSASVKAAISLAACTTLITSSAFVASAQQDRTWTRLSGNVAPAMKLSVESEDFAGDSGGGSSASVRASVEQAGGDFVQLGFGGQGAGQRFSVNIPLAIRTNSGYRLRLGLVSSDGCAPVLRASLSSPRPSGKSVATDAESSCRLFGPIYLEERGEPLTILAGTRVSSRGNFTSPGNALLVDLTLEVSSSQPAACAWHTSIRILIDSGF